MAKIDNMMGPNVRMSTHVTTARQTPDTGFGKRLQNGLNGAASAVGAGVGTVAGFVPGGAVLSAAVSSMQTFSNTSGSGINGGSPYVGVMSTAVGAGGAGASVGGAVAGLGGAVAPSTGVNVGSTTGGGLGGAGGAGPTDQVNGNFSLGQMAQENAKLLNLQASINHESQVFNAISNVMKARNDTIKNTLGNVR